LGKQPHRLPTTGFNIITDVELDEASVTKVRLFKAPSLKGKLMVAAWKTDHEGILIAGKLVTYDSVKSVEGGGFTLSVNLVKAVRSFSIKVTTLEGEIFTLADEGVSKASTARQASIRELHSTICRATYSNRLNYLVRSLIDKSAIDIGVEYLGSALTPIGLLYDLFVPKTAGSITLTRDGQIRRQKPELALNLKRCLKAGALEIGVSRGNGRWPDQVYASYGKTWVLERGRSTSIRFNVICSFGADVALNLISWLAEPNSKL